MERTRSRHAPSFMGTTAIPTRPPQIVGEQTVQKRQTRGEGVKRKSRKSQKKSIKKGGSDTTNNSSPCVSSIKSDKSPPGLRPRPR